jgi:SAM-dependent methyltransferase
MVNDFLDQENARFWDEPCGTTAALNLSKNLQTLVDFEVFDSWYKQFYPYLFQYLESLPLSRSSVLEIGVGYGTVSRFLSENSKSLTLLDIAPGALEFVSNSIRNQNVHCVNQSILDFDTKFKYDIVIAIGSLHHTGDLEQALEKVENLLNENGTLLVMVYYAFQPRRIILHPLRSIKEFFQTLRFSSQTRYTFEEIDEGMRGRADSNSAGQAAPYTAFSSRKLFINRGQVKYNYKLHNFHHVPILSKLISRKFCLKYFSHFLGCDIYALGTSISSNK